MTAITGAERRTSFSVGQTLRATFDAIGANLQVLLPVAIVLAGVPQLLFALLAHSMPTGPSNPFGVFTSPFIGLVFILSVVANLLLEVAVIRAVVIYLNGRKPQIAECFSGLGAVVLPLIGLSLLMGLGFFVAAILLFVPFLILWTVWSVAVPALVVERRGVFAALSRSRDLSRGCRWAIFGAGLLLIVIMMGLGLVGGIVGGVFMAIGLVASGLSGVFTLIGEIVSAAIGSLGGLIATTFIATVYVELRRVKEGATPETLAAVFD